jgi:hypothetical protein
MVTLVAVDVGTLAGSGAQGWADRRGTAAHFSSPAGLAVGPQGDVFISEASHVIRKITPLAMLPRSQARLRHPAAPMAQLKTRALRSWVA